MEPGTGFGSCLLRQQINHIELLESRKNSNDDRRGNDWRDCRKGNISGPLQPCCPIKNSTFIIASVDGLHSAIDDHDHKRKCKPQIHHRAAEKCRHITAQSSDCLMAKLFHPLIQKSKLCIEHTGLPEQNGYVTRHSPGKHQQGLIEFTKFQLLDIQ